jgi:hypothetical protein
MGANGRRIRENKEQPAEHAERRRKRNSCQGGHSVSVLIQVHPWSIPFFAPAGRKRGQRSARRRTCRAVARYAKEDKQPRQPGHGVVQTGSPPKRPDPRPFNEQRAFQPLPPQYHINCIMQVYFLPRMARINTDYQDRPLTVRPADHAE